MSEHRKCPAFRICQEPDSREYSCLNTNPPFAPDTDSARLDKLSYQLEEIKTCLHSLVLLLSKK